MTMKRLMLVWVMIMCVIMLSSCTAISILAMTYAGNSDGGTNRSSDVSQEFWGSYTAEETYSFDRRYYALQTVVDKPEDYSVRMVKVTVYLTETDEPVDAFYTARARDFWGICWERDSYNIWAQSGDIDVPCFEYRDGKWIKNWDMTRPPAYIITNLDPEYRNHPELWDTIYVSPTE